MLLSMKSADSDQSMKAVLYAPRVFASENWWRSRRVVATDELKPTFRVPSLHNVVFRDEGKLSVNMRAASNVPKSLSKCQLGPRSHSRLLIGGNVRRHRQNGCGGIAPHRNHHFAVPNGLVVVCLPQDCELSNHAPHLHWVGHCAFAWMRFVIAAAEESAGLLQDLASGEEDDVGPVRS